MSRLGLHVALLVALGSFALPRPAAAYSVLAHEALVDAAWETAIAPMLRQRFPGTPVDRIAGARAYAYGGSVIQDLGYYPFGSHFFTDLLHYVRSGDFIEALIRDARDVDEYAFALGALAHYSADTIGHAVAVNRAVPIVYPKLRQKYGAIVTYDDDPKRHIMMEFAFDVVQVAGGGYVPQRYRDFIGFEVSKPLLERAFKDTYGLEIGDIFPSVDLAIGTYRWAVSRLIPDITRLAWRDKQDEIRKGSPDVEERAFVYSINRSEYEQQFGTSYRKPGLLARFLVTIVKVLPKIGPLSVLAFRPPTPEAERLFNVSFDEARQRYRSLLDLARRNTLDLRNADFDTGRLTARGEYRRADEAYAELRHKLAGKPAASVPVAMRRDLERFFAQPPAVSASH
jgi:zinc dependent phospholipase C